MTTEHMRGLMQKERIRILNKRLEDAEKEIKALTALLAELSDKLKEQDKQRTEAVKPKRTRKTDGQQNG